VEQYQMKKSILLLCLFALISTSAHAKLYKCKDQYNRSSFQDKPCSLDKALKKEEKQEAIKDTEDKALDTRPKTQAVDS